MAMVPFHSRFDVIAFQEMQTFVVPKGFKLLPPGDYGLLELFCEDQDCDCRRVILLVVRPDGKNKIWATINFGWETADFYTEWSHDPESAQEMASATLEPFGAQSKYSPALLDLCKTILRDSAYLDRLKRHYQMFRNASSTSLPA